MVSQKRAPRACGAFSGATRRHKCATCRHWLSAHVFTSTDTVEERPKGPQKAPRKKKIGAKHRRELESVCTHIEGHIACLREYLAKNDRDGVKDQAAEIEAWGQGLRQDAADI